MAVKRNGDIAIVQWDSCQSLLNTVLPQRWIVVAGMLLALCPVAGVSQWTQMIDSIIPPDHRVFTMEIAPDRSIWILASHISFSAKDRIEPKLIRSIDEGKTWSVTSMPVEPVNRTMDICPLDSLTAFAALMNSGLWKTTDGGRSWSRIEMLGRHPSVVHFFDEMHGWTYQYAGRRKPDLNIIIHSVTSDGGKTWKHIGGKSWAEPPGTSLPPRDSFERWGFGYNISSMYDVHDDMIILGSSHGHYWKSMDRGHNWTRHRTPFDSTGTRISTIAIKDENTFVVSGNLGPSGTRGKRDRDTRTFTTFDGGKTWAEGRPGVTAASLHYLKGTDSTLVMVGHREYWYGGGKGTAISHNFGANWKRLDNRDLIVADFLDKNYGFATYANNDEYASVSGQIYKWDYTWPDPQSLGFNWLPWAVGAGVLLIATLLHLIRMRQIRRQSDLALQIAQYEQAALQAQMNPHFIFNALNSLQSYVNSNDKASSNRFLVYFSKLIRGTLKASNAGTITLRNEIELLTSYLELEKMRFHNRFDFKITIDDAIDLDTMYIPSMITQPLVENAVIHGLAGVKSGGLIALEYNMGKEDLLIITLQDNGPGISGSISKKPEGHKSTGLRNTRKRLLLLHDENDMEITDIGNLPGESAGTKVIQYIHLNHVAS